MLVPAVRARPLAGVYDEAYRGPPPSWEIGAPQPAFVALFSTGVIEGPVLDLGCGTGELSLFLAEQGLEVLGLDASAVAIQAARGKAAQRGLDARFVVWDAVDLSPLADGGLSVATAVDCAFSHVLRLDQRDRLADGLEGVLEPGGLYCVLGDARTVPGVTYGITPGELQARFGHRPGWRMAFAYRARFQRRGTSNPAYMVGVRWM